MRSRRALRAVAVLPLLLALLLAPPLARAVPPGRPPALTVLVTPTAPRQGDMVFVLVTGAQNARQVEGSLDGRPLTFFPYGESWAAVVGVDLEAAPRKGTWRVGVIDAAGAAQQKAGTVTIRRRTFPEQRLSLPDYMVDLDPESERRANAEAAQLRTLYDSATPERFWQGRFTLPVAIEGPGSGFGSRRVINGKARSPHGGTDWSADRGTPVVAANRGRVALVGDFFFGGRLVVLDHGLGLYTLYMHLDRVDVAEGAIVTRGETLGVVGSTGRATGPHLHFQVQAGRARIDPATLFALPVGD
jgi:murein DD-endopeptidase MepM/ murein hydrolase activator NlpD